MRKCFLTLLVTIFLLLVGLACQPAVVEASLGQELSLAIGDRAVVAGENLQIRFDDVVEDSRCPTGATCVWEGRVICWVEVTQNGDSYGLMFIQPGLSDQPAEQSHLGYQFAFTVVPYPELDKEIASGDYRLLPTVTR